MRLSHAWTRLVHPGVVVGMLSPMIHIPSNLRALTSGIRAFTISKLTDLTSEMQQTTTGAVCDGVRRSTTCWQPHVSDAHVGGPDPIPIEMCPIQLVSLCNRWSEECIARTRAQDTRPPIHSSIMIKVLRDVALKVIEATKEWNKDGWLPINLQLNRQLRANRSGERHTHTQHMVSIG